ncbi:hypothetical protein [Lutimaribacter saemankumensis]|uniref:Mono-oxygenase ydhR n=1 Tax=Lutimaribacter saemankumensis TaxID=490829 RepID=A0A1G8P1T3_9RHOB|nr:hypothetical protein [Lutimaribacter saemankumensis]SDI86218.1 hypothetical protein SAMN05421850_10640 [Lutimaribacter saemankumensis]
MITEIVRFTIAPGIDRDEVIRRFETTMPAWQANEKLVRKYYLFDEETRQGGGVYLWPDKAAAQAAHNEEWCDRAEKLYGSRPTFEYFETPCIVDNSG